VTPAEPLFILAAPRSTSSVSCAMLGQHPQMYGLPETHLFRFDTMAPWFEHDRQHSFQIHGLLRVVAEVYYGGQTARTVAAARGWLRRRANVTSGALLEEIATTLAPRILVDKSPSTVYAPDRLGRTRTFFPAARYIHLVRHPRPYCTSVLTYLDTLSRPDHRTPGAADGAGEAPEWIDHLASFPYGDLPPRDPQGGWYALNTLIVDFLAAVPDARWTTVRAEDLVGDPAAVSARLAGWLGLRTDEAAVSRMLHPELSPYARFGPPGAREGNDIFFLERPALRSPRPQTHVLEGPLPWRADGAGFLPEVCDLARRFGYE